MKLLNKKFILGLLITSLIFGNCTICFAGNGNGGSKGATMFHNAQEIGLKNKEHAYVLIGDEIYDFTYTGSKLTCATQAPVEIEEYYNIYKDIDLVNLLGEISLIEHGKGNHKDAISASDEYWIEEFKPFIPIEPLIEEEEKEESIEKIVEEDPEEENPEIEEVITTPGAITFPEEIDVEEESVKEQETIIEEEVITEEKELPEKEIIEEEPIIEEEIKSDDEKQEEIKTEIEEETEQEIKEENIDKVIEESQNIEEKETEEENSEPHKDKVEKIKEETIEEIEVFDEEIPLAESPIQPVDNNCLVNTDELILEDPVEFEIFEDAVPLADVPQTGDASNIYLVMFLISIIAIVMMLVSYKKTKQSH